MQKVFSVTIRCLSINVDNERFLEKEKSTTVTNYFLGKLKILVTKINRYLSGHITK